MKQAFLVLLWVGIVLLGFFACPVWAGYDDGEAAYLNGEFSTALEIWKPLAEQGHADAQNMLGYMYRFGEGVDPDYALARKWYRLAADQGNPSAQNNLGVMYRLGLGEPRIFRKRFIGFIVRRTKGMGEPRTIWGLCTIRGKGLSQIK